MLIIFSDIDGTLIDFDTYSWTETAVAVNRVLARGIPLVLCSSKTRAEQLYYRERLAIPDPFIVENGSAIFLPEGLFPADAGQRPAGNGLELIELGVGAAIIRAALHTIRVETGLAFRGFSDLSAAEVSAITGMDLDAARRARARDYSETIATPLPPAELCLLRDRLAAYDLAIVSGGRFHTVTARHSDKGTAVARLTDLYRRQWGTAVTTIGLGDSANDAPLLAAVDEAYLVQKPDGRWQDVGDVAVRRVTAVGPAGWRQAVLARLGE